MADTASPVEFHLEKELHADLKVKTEVRTNKLTNLKRSVSEYRDLLVRSEIASDQKTKANYLPENFDLNEQVLISGAFFKNKLIAFSSAFVNSEYYPDKSLRVLNRFYIDPSSRAQEGAADFNGYIGHPRQPLVSLEMAKQQVALASSLGFSAAFVSREVNNPRWAKSFSKSLSQHCGVNWVVEEELKPVCFLESPLCWQRIIWTPIISGYTDLKFHGSLTEQDFKEKFGL